MGWEIHDQVEDPECLDDSAIEDISGTTAEREAAIEERLKNLCDPSVETKRALILYCSHIGGHKFAGNVIVSRTPRLETSFLGLVLTINHPRFTLHTARGSGTVEYLPTRLTPS